MAMSRSTGARRRGMAATVATLAVAALALIGIAPADAATPATARTRSFVLTRGEYRAVEVPDATITLIHGINNDGDATGAYVDTDGKAHGFLRDGGA